MTNAEKEKQVQRNMKQQNRKQLIEHYHLNQMLKDHEHQQAINDKRTYFGPEGLTNDQEKAITQAKKAQTKKALEAQISQNAF